MLNSEQMEVIDNLEEASSCTEAASESIEQQIVALRQEKDTDLEYTKKKLRKALELVEEVDEGQ